MKTLKYAVKRAWLAVLVTTLAFLASTPLAQAGPPRSDWDPKAVAPLDQLYLPLYRWSGSTTSFHARFASGPMGLDLSWIMGAQRGAQGQMMNVGNFFYSVTSALIVMADQFTPLKMVGGVVDKAANVLGAAVINSSILVAILAITIIALIINETRGRIGIGAMLKGMAGKALVLAIMLVMVTGAANSTGGGINGDNSDFKPGTGSPGWVATKVEDSIGTLTKDIAAKAVDGTLETNLNSVFLSGKKGDYASCQAYMTAMRKLYLEALATNKKGSGVTMVALSSLWEDSGYVAFAFAQFGENNRYGLNNTACRMLEAKAPVPIYGEADAAATGTGERSSASVWWIQYNASRLYDQSWFIMRNGNTDKVPQAFRRLDKVETDKQMIAWAVCQNTDYTSDSGWTKRDNGVLLPGPKVDDKVFNDACKKFFNEPTAGPIDNIFDWGDGDKKLNEKPRELVTLNFVSNLHGAASDGGGFVGAYVFSALSASIVFGSLNLAKIIAEVMVVFSLLSILATMVFSLLPSRGGDNKLLKHGKELLGYLLFAAMISLLTTVIVLFTKVIVLMAVTLSNGGGNMLTATAVAVAPILAAVGVHNGFKRAGVPSPMSLKGGSSWGKALAGGAASGAAMAGIGGLAGMLKREGRYAGRRAMRRGGRNVLSTLTGGKVGGKGKRGADSGGKGQSGDPSGKKGNEATESLDETGQKATDYESVLKDKGASAAEKREAEKALREERVKAGAGSAGDHVKTALDGAEGVKGKAGALAGLGAGAVADKLSGAKAKAAAFGKAVTTKEGWKNTARAAGGRVVHAATHPVATVKGAAKLAGKAALVTAALGTGGVGVVAVGAGAVAVRKVMKARGRSAADNKQRVADYRQQQHDVGVAANKQAETDRKAAAAAEERANRQAEQDYAEARRAEAEARARAEAEAQARTPEPQGGAGDHKARREQQTHEEQLWAARMRDVDDYNDRYGRR